MFKKRFGCLYLPLGLMFLVCVSAIIFLPDCSSTSETAKAARNLSQERLGLLYQQMANLIEQHLVDGEFVHLRGEDVPAEFHDLNCHSISFDDYSARIILKHCIDHSQDLIFEGLTKYQKEDSEKPAIILCSNEFDIEEEVLWSKK